MTLTLPMDAEKIVPHRLPMRLVDRLLEADGKNGVVEACVAADSPLVSRNGELEEVALIELMAQSYAAIKGYSDLTCGRPIKQGFLVGVKKLVRLQSARAGNLLRINIRTVAELDDFSVTEGEIWCGTEMISHGEIKLWVN